MKKKLIVISLVVACFALTAGAVGAASERNITKKLGGNSGDKFTLNGLLFTRNLKVNSTSQFVGALSNPVGDLKIADNLKVTGLITASGGIAYDHTLSGLEATTVKGAIDELGIQLKDLLKGTTFSATSSNVHAAAANSTWTGYMYSFENNGVNWRTFTKSAMVTCTFTPDITNDEQGTYSCDKTNPFYGVDWNGGPYTGTYYLASGTDAMFSIETSPDNTQVGMTSLAQVTHNSMIIQTSRTIPNKYFVLTRQ